MLTTWHGALSFSSFRGECAGGVAVIPGYPFQGCVMLHQHSSVQSSFMLIDQCYMVNVQFEMHAVQLAYSVSAVNPIAGFVLLAYVTV